MSERATCGTLLIRGGPATADPFTEAWICPLHGPAAIHELRLSPTGGRPRCMRPMTPDQDPAKPLLRDLCGAEPCICGLPKPRPARATWLGVPSDPRRSAPPPHDGAKIRLPDALKGAFSHPRARRCVEGRHRITRSPGELPPSRLRVRLRLLAPDPEVRWPNEVEA